MGYPATFELPTTDTLTGLLTSHYFRHLLRERWLPEVEESGEPLSLFMLDTDNFADVNERYGHEAGDAVLRAVSRAMQETLPPSAQLARYGGDEFVALLPETRVDDAFTLAEELRRRIGAISFEQWPACGFTASIGLAGFPVHGQTDVELIRAADQALYQAKITGRNKVALPLTDSRMVTKTSYYTQTQLQRLSELARTVGRNEATLLREALDDLLKKYNDRLGAPPRERER